MPSRKARLIVEGVEYELPLLEGTDGRLNLDITELREKAGIYTFDPNLSNTAVARSAVSWIDQEKGILLYRGYNINELVEKSSFVETSYLLIEGKLPNEVELRDFSTSLSKHSMIHEAMRNFYDAFPGDAHPLAILSVMVTSLSSYYPATYEQNMLKGIDVKTRLLAKIRTLAAWSYKKFRGEPLIYPRDELPYCTNFLNMLFANPSEPYSVKPEHDRVLNQILILYSDHELNVATSTVRIVGSTDANLFACISAGTCALWGARDSGVRMPPMRMLNAMIENHQDPEQYFERFIKGREPMFATGLGHANYGGIDPRAKLMKSIFHDFLKKNTEYQSDPIMKKALEVEAFCFGHPYFMEKNLYPNLDFYSALAFYTLGIPPQMMNVVRVIAKTAGWLAHWYEERGGNELSFRPRQIYSGERERAYAPVEKRA